MRENYREFVIDARPYELAEEEGGGWVPSITIERHYGDKINTRQFTAENSYKDKEMAVSASIENGKKIIDGQIPDCSVADL